MIKLQSKSNVNAPSIPYPYGSLRDNPGDNTGTPVNTVLLGDTMQLMEKIMAESGITPNGLPDNQSNGWQLYEALMKITTPAYKSYVVKLSQSGTSAPSVSNVFENSLNGAYVWTRSGVGNYTLTISGQPALTTKTHVMISQGVSTIGGFLLVSVVSDGVINFNTYDDVGNLSDDILNSANLEIRVYN